jgi:hypothetical protein
MNYEMGVAFLVALTAIAALLVGNLSGHMTFARGTNQDQGCESAGGVSGINEACTATSTWSSTQTGSVTSTFTPGSTQRVVMSFHHCQFTGPIAAPLLLGCDTPLPPIPVIFPEGHGCNNIGCQSVSCPGHGIAVPPSLGNFGVFIVNANCITDNGVQLTSCSLSALISEYVLSCIRTTGTPNSGGITVDG